MIFDAGDIVREHFLKKSFAVFAPHKNLSHMGNIKQPCGRSYLSVFLQNPGVLNRQFPSTESDHFPTKFTVFFI
jgi:hypothetical protein